jgi:hypothetical protein
MIAGQSIVRGKSGGQLDIRRRISEVQRALAAARDAGHPYEVYLHQVRLAELVDAAGRTGVDVAGLVDPAMLPAAGPYLGAD